MKDALKFLGGVIAVGASVCIPLLYGLDIGTLLLAVVLFGVGYFCFQPKEN